MAARFATGALVCRLAHGRWWRTGGVRIVTPEVARYAFPISSRGVFEMRNKHGVCAAVALGVFLALPAQATVLCAHKKSGVMALRPTACKAKETVLDPTILGLRGPTGPMGPAGDVGPDGAMGPMG